MRILLTFIGFYMVMSSPLSAQKTDLWLKDLLYEQGSSLLKQILDKPEVYQFQVVYTQIERDKQNRPSFRSYYLNYDRDRYFNPASTVKLPAALIALEKLNDLKIPSLDKYTAMLIDSNFSGQTKVDGDSSSESGYASVANYIKKIFLVSDNDAYNRLYEFDGQELLNERLWSKGYKNTRITRRFVPMTEEENRNTNAIRFVKDGAEVYTQEALRSNVKFDFNKKILIGRAHYNRQEVLVNEPMDFSRHNTFPLEEQQLMLRAVLFPESTDKKHRFGLSDDDYAFLYRYMSMTPGKSDYPRYDKKEFFDSYAKFFLFRADKAAIPEHLKIFNKAGWSYGFLTDNAYIIDLDNNVEFMISATIYVNSDGVLNDDKYDYETVGYPFFKEVGQVIYKNELQRPRKYVPDLGRFK